MASNRTGSAAAVWDKSAAGYDQHRKTDSVYWSCIRQVAKEVPRKAHLCLDAGCGTGMATCEIARRADTVIAIDYSLKSLQTLQTKNIPNILLVQADVRALPFIDSVFDATVCANTLQHLCPGDSQESAVDELRRVTGKNCKIAVSVHHYSHAKRRAGWKKEGKPGQADVDYIFRFEKEDLLAIMPEARTRAVGYYELLKVPFLGSRVQNITGTVLGRTGPAHHRGHMLVGVEKNKKA